MNVVQAVARQAFARPNATAVINPTGELTYGQLIADVVQLASRMAELGVTRGDVVGISTRDNAAHILLTLATAWLGGVSVSLATGESSKDRARNAERCGVKFLFHSETDVTDLARAGVSLCMSLRDLFARPAGKHVAMVQAEPSDIWRIAFTSGTTGRPKAMKIAHEAMILKNQALGSVVPIDPGDRILIQMGAGLVFALTYWLRALAAGATVVTAHADFVKTWEALHAHEVTFLVTTPGNGDSLLAVGRARNATGGPPSLRRVMIGGAPVTLAQREALRRHLCDNLLINYGASEIGMIALLDSALMDRDPACAGRLMDWLDVEVIDEKGHPIPPGKGEGLLRMRSATIASGYMLWPDSSPEDAQAFRDGWFYSKDIGRVSLDGRVYLSGRANDVINLGGYKVEPARVEELLASEPGVLECALVGVTDESGMPALVAVLVPQGEFDWQRLRSRCAEVLPAMAVPRAHVTVAALPRNPAGKVMRNELARRIKFRRRAPGADAGVEA